jgi:hypothetical protein
VSESESSESEDDGTGLGFRRLPALDRVTRSRGTSGTSGASGSSGHAQAGRAQVPMGPALLDRSAANTQGSTAGENGHRTSTGLRLRWGEDVGRRPPE